MGRKGTSERSSRPPAQILRLRVLVKTKSASIDASKKVRESENGLRQDSQAMDFYALTKKTNESIIVFHDICSIGQEHM